MTQVFGSRQLPPPSLLPGKVSDAVEAWRGAAKDAAEAKAELGNHRRVAIPAARREDVEAHAAALEAHKPPPKSGANEQRAHQRLAQLERQAAASELVESRARARMDERISEQAGAIAHAAERRMAEAKKRFLSAIDDLEASVEELTTAIALKAWSEDPSQSYKQRGLRNVPVPQHSDDGPDIGMVVGALRQVLEPRHRPPMPSPFGVRQPQAEPAPAGPDFAAELAAGMPESSAR